MTSSPAAVAAFSLSDLISKLPPGITADRTVRMYGRGDRIVEFTRLRGGDWMVDICVDVDDPTDVDLTVNRAPERPEIRRITGYMTTGFVLDELPIVLRAMKRHVRSYARQNADAGRA